MLNAEQMKELAPDVAKLKAGFVEQGKTTRALTDEKALFEYSEALMMAYSKGVKECLETLDEYHRTRKFDMIDPSVVYKAFVTLALLIPYKAVGLNPIDIARDQTHAYYKAVEDVGTTLDKITSLLESKDASHH